MTKRAVGIIAAVVAQAFLWFASMFIWSWWVDDLVRAIAGDAYWSTWGAAVRPYMLVYWLLFLAVNIVIVCFTQRFFQRVGPKVAYVAACVTANNLVYVGFILTIIVNFRFVE